MSLCVTLLLILTQGTLLAQIAEATEEENRKPSRNVSFEYRFSDDLKQTADSEAHQDRWFRDATFGAFIYFGVYSTLDGQCKGRGSRHRDAVDRALTSPSQAGNRGGRTGHGAGFGADLHQSGRRRGSAGHMQGAFSSVRRNSRSSINGLSERMIRAPSLRATRGRLNFRIT